MKHNERGAWLFEGGHTFDAWLCIAVYTVFGEYGVKSIMDVGCGDGSYTKHLRAHGFDAEGYDANPYTPEGCYIADFSEPQYLDVHDAVLCLEVGEHIPADYEPVFLDNLVRHAEKLIILSWAVPGQGGFGHVNERDNEYVIKRMNERGWNIDQSSTDFVRNQAAIAWFKNTVMVFTHGD